MQLLVSCARKLLLLTDNKEELIESQMEKLFCIWMYEDVSDAAITDLVVTKE